MGDCRRQRTSRPAWSPAMIRFRDVYRRVALTTTESCRAVYAHRLSRGPSRARFAPLPPHGVSARCMSSAVRRNAALTLSAGSTEITS
jgi:hypothetical protein